MSIYLSKQSIKFLYKLPQKQRSIIEASIESLQRNTSNQDIKKLLGIKRDYYRLRVGNIRVIYSKSKTDYYIEKIEFRGKIYKIL